MAELKTDRDIFSKSGPSHIKSIDWTDLFHRTAVAASLVKGVSVLERLGLNSQAEAWWESFNFTLLETLDDDKNDVVYGAIFEYQDTPSELSPRYVIAFRGMILQWKTCADIKLGISFAFDKLHRTSTVAHIIGKVKTFVEKHKNKDVWLAGHSLGAAIALLAGKTMVRKSGISLETYAFNPPISAIPIHLIMNNHFLQNVTRACWTLGKALIVLGHQEQNQEEDTKIASWIPHLYLNLADPLCSEYTGYFSNRKLMCRIGLGKIADKAVRYTFRSHLFGPREEGTSSQERLHIFPSAKMIVIKKVKSTKLKVAHGLSQWWDPDVRKEWDFSFHGELH